MAWATRSTRRARCCASTCRRAASAARRAAASTSTADVRSPRMDFSLTPEQREIQALAREGAEAEIAPNAAAWDREHRFPEELFAKLGALGLMGVCVPERYGGAGADFLSYVLVLA